MDRPVAPGCLDDLRAQRNTSRGHVEDRIRIALALFSYPEEFPPRLREEGIWIVPVPLSGKQLGGF